MMNTILFYSILLLLLGRSSIKYYSMGAPIVNDHRNSNNENEMIQTQEIMENSQQQCQRSMTYEEIHDLLAHSPCALDMKYNKSKLRRKRSDNDPSTNNIYALQSTINDHRSIMDDHRTMINYLMNNTVNITQLSQYYTEQHTKTTPIWKSWRDVSLLLLIFICFCAIIYVLAIRFHPLDILTSILLRRHQKQTKMIHKKTSMRQHHKDFESPSMISTIPIPTTERDYKRYDQDSNSSR